MHGGIKKQITGKKILGKYTKNQLTGILKAMKEITQNYQDSRYPIESIFKAIKNAVNIKQDKKELLAVFTKRFKNAKDIMETQHGKLTL